MPSTVFAQASIAGVVRDTSGAVLPGVTVEAASPVLIEKVRTTVSDGNGRFQIIDLRPGTYAVTFTLPGFNSVRRDGVELSGAQTMSVDAELRVGALEETVTVTGEAPTVDVQTATRQTVLDREIVQNIPTARNYYSLGSLITGVNSNSADVGGALGDTMSSLTIHGSKNQDQRITNNGVSVMTLQAGGNIGGPTPDVSSAAEVAIDTSAAGADLPTGGVRINLIPRDGGNDWSSSSFFTFSNEAMAGDNYTKRVQDLGAGSTNKTITNMDINPAFGGPISRNRVWFWTSVRHTSVESQPADSFINRNAWNPNAWLPDFDTSQPARNKGVWHSINTRFTIQATAKHKFAATWQQQNYCRCPDDISADTAPEAGRDRRFPRLQQQHAEWTSPLTNRLLVEAVGMHLYERWGNMHYRSGEGNFFKTGGSLDPQFEQFVPQMISVQEQSIDMTYRSMVNFNNTSVPNYFYRAAVSYVTGTHNLKVGFNRVHGYQITRTYNFQPYQYRFNNGIPNQITVYATPYQVENHQDNDVGLFVQDRYTMSRWTLSGGLRFDVFQTSFPEQVIGPGDLVPNRNITFPEQNNTNWKDITYRSAAAWDVFGTGRTAFKISLNKFLLGQTLNALGGADTNPFNTLVRTANRSWTDANRDYVPQCDLVVLDANGECGPINDRGFGSNRPGASFDPDLLTGWGNRNYNWEFSTGVQHEVLPRVAVDVGYFRRWFGNFRVTDNVALAASDYTRFQVTAPRDSRLPDGGGQTLTVFNVVPEKFGLVQNYNTLSKKYGDMSETWNGVDVTLNARLQNGITASLGFATGKRVTDNCDIVAKIPELLTGNGSPALGTNIGAAPWMPLEYCHQEEPFLTQVKAYGVYMIPRVDVLVSGTLQSTPGPLVYGNFNANNAYLAANSTLGRPLSGRAANIGVNLVEPGALYGERLNQLDMRFGKIFRAGGTRTNVSLDVYNILNKDTVRTLNNTFGPAWQRPQSILLARFLKISATFDF
jgi:hypothetical protein